jgi:hypothetical protein
MFPSGWPGRGLLLLRAVSGMLLVHDGILKLFAAPQLGEIVQQLIAVCAGAILLAGWCTPMAGLMVLIDELWVGLSGVGQLRGSIVLASIGGALAMLGPGVWSIDARLFGRKRIDISQR